MSTGIKITASIDELAHLEALRQQVQRHRIQMGNRISAIERGDSNGNVTVAEHFSDRFQGIEDELSAIIGRTVKDHPVWPWLDEVKGIGPGLAGAILAPIDIRRANSVSALWKYAGQGVTDGERDRPRKGEKLPYNAGLKRNCYLVATSFMRANSPYRAVYDEAKSYYERTRPDWTAGHRDMAAKRKMIKIFLAHLWVVWRDAERLPLSPPYASKVLEHDGIIPPWRYVPEYPYSEKMRDHFASMSRVAA